jgi:glc operon protein GlcG
LKSAYYYPALALVACVALAGKCNAYADSAGAASTIPTDTISFATSMKLLDAASRAAQAKHLAMSFAIVDLGGHLVAAARMDGAPFASLDFARGKAFASVALGGQSGATLEQRAKENASEYANMAGAGYYAPFLPGRGVLPIFIGGRLVGALGASGAPGDVDEAAVKGAIEAIGASTTR